MKQNKIKMGLNKDDWELVKRVLQQCDTEETDELYDKIKGLGEDEFEYEEEFYLRPTNDLASRRNLDWKYVGLFPDPKSSLKYCDELDEDFFMNQTLLVSYKNEEYGGIVYYGKIKNRQIYVKLDDHPGSSGYDCCGYIRLTYSKTFTKSLQNL